MADSPFFPVMNHKIQYKPPNFHSLVSTTTIINYENQDQQTEQN
jgi:hypothetical protein